MAFQRNVGTVPLPQLDDQSPVNMTMNATLCWLAWRHWGVHFFSVLTCKMGITLCAFLVKRVTVFWVLWIHEQCDYQWDRWRVRDVGPHQVSFTRWGVGSWVNSNDSSVLTMCNQKSQEHLKLSSMLSLFWVFSFPITFPPLRELKLELKGP